MYVCTYIYIHVSLAGIAVLGAGLGKGVDVPMCRIGMIYFDYFLPEETSEAVGWKCGDMWCDFMGGEIRRFA